MRSPSRKGHRHRAVDPSPDVNLDGIAGDVRYVGSPEHKTAPSFAGPPRPRPDASICDPRFLAMQDELTFDIEWIVPEAVRVPEFEATWAELRMEVGGRPLTRFQDERAHSLRRSLVLPLYPLAEWVANNWWSLLYESVTPGRPGTQADYARRHDLRFARAGYALPNVRFAPAGERVRVSWSPTRLQHYHIEFLDGGIHWIETSVFKEAFTGLLDAVAARLEQHDVRDTAFQSEWAAIRSADAEETAFCEAAARLGKYPYALTGAEEDALLDAADMLPPSLYDAFFGAAHPGSLHAQARHLADATEQLQHLGGRAVHLVALRSEHTVDRGRRLPWEEGYAQARRLRERLSRTHDIFPSTADVAAAFFADAQDAERRILTYESDHLFDALVATNIHDAPGFALDARRDDARKFALCRGLFEYLNAANGSPLLVTREQTERQKRNRAFAAEFLAPSHLLANEVSGRVVSQEEVDDLAAHFGVSSYVIAHQLQNHDVVEEVIS